LRGDSCANIEILVPESDLTLARAIHKSRREVPEISVIARKSKEITGCLSEKYVEDRQDRITLPVLADTVPYQRACE
jgi:hypothetical protein